MKINKTWLYSVAAGALALMLVLGGAWTKVVPNV